MAQLAGLADGTEARTLIRSLARSYDEGRYAFRVVEVAGGFQLRTRTKFAPWLRRLAAAEVQVRLSAPAMETLAVVAYRQPVLRAEVEAVRGVQCGEILRQLLDRDLIRIVGRSDDLGRPLRYGTTKRFLEVFGLKRLDDLPRSGAPGPVREMPVTAASAREDLPEGVPPNEDTPSEPHQPTLKEEVNVKSAGHSRELFEEMHQLTALVAGPEEDDFDDEEEFEDEEEEFEDEEEEEEEFEDEDEDLEDDDWEEVEDDEEEEDDEDWDDEDDEDWDDEDDEDWEEEE